jgi:hypothetical protein
MGKVSGGFETYEIPSILPHSERSLSGVIFVFIFLCGSRNEYRNIKNKYENEYF